MARQPLTPNPLYGWDPKRKVETEYLGKAPSGRRYAVYVDGKHVGFVQSLGRDWDYFTQAALDAYRAEGGMKVHSDTPRLAYGARSRHDAVNNLLTHLRLS